MKATDPAAPRGDTTRDNLVAAALGVFAQSGFEAATTRAIADAAGVNQALIGYHFRHKEGLYLAVFEHILAQMRGRIGPLAVQVQAALATADDTAAGRGQLRALLMRITDGMSALLTEERTAPWARLIIREQQAPTAAFDILYQGFMGPMLGLLTLLVQRIRGDGRGEGGLDAARLTAVTLAGQVLVFRAAHAGALRHLEWTQVGPAELAAIQACIRDNVAALLPLAAPADPSLSRSE